MTPTNGRDDGDTVQEGPGQTPLGWFVLLVHAAVIVVRLHLGGGRLDKPAHLTIVPQ